MNSPSPSPNFELAMRLERDRRVIRRMRFLPALMFLAFFISNTRLSPLSGWMLLGRWGALIGLFVIAWVITENASRKPWPPLAILFIVAFIAVAGTLPSSSNPIISAIKWTVFFIFLLFCGMVFSRVNSAQDVETLLVPLSWIFVFFIWFFLPSVFLFTQPLRGSLGYFNGFLRFTNAVGEFLTIGGVPLMLYRLNLARTPIKLYFFTATLVLGSFQVLLSGSRAAAFSLILILGLALLRWKTPKSGLANTVRIGAVITLIAISLWQTDRVRAFVYKYPDASNLLESRQSYWDATSRSFRTRQWMGTGFGVQEEQAKSSLSFSTTGAFREQGSFYLGILEEIGYFGAVPILLVLLVFAGRNGIVLLRSRDPAKLTFARSVLAGLLYGVSENYVLYLGNAASILFFFSIFLNERLLYLESREHEWARQQQSMAVRWTAASESGPRAVRPGAF